MKLFKRSSLLVIALILVLSLTSCGKISQGYADKVNKAAEAGEHYDYDKVMKDLGKEAVWIGGEVFGSHSGVVIAVKGCQSYDDIKTKLDEGKTVKGIIVTVLANKAQSAKFTEITESDLK